MLQNLCMHTYYLKTPAGVCTCSVCTACWIDSCRFLWAIACVCTNSANSEHHFAHHQVNIQSVNEGYACELPTTNELCQLLATLEPNFISILHKILPSYLRPPFTAGFMRMCLHYSSPQDAFSKICIINSYNTSITAEAPSHQSRPVPKSDFSEHVKAMHQERDSGFEKVYMVCLYKCV